MKWTYSYKSIFIAIAVANTEMYDVRKRAVVIFIDAIAINV